MKSMEETVERSKRLALMGEMASVLANEMRNPIAAMSGSIQMLKRDLNLSKSDEKLMQIILRGKDQIENFIRDFLLLAKPAVGVREQIDLKEVIGEIVESIRYVPDWHDSIEIRRSFTTTTQICANRGEIRQVIWNLLLNAVQSMPDGGMVKIDVKSATVHDFEDHIEVSISDTGCGIEERNMKKILGPFYTTKERGTGLGLAIVSRIVEGYAGSIRFESALQRGTTCRISIPRRGNGNPA